MQGLYAIIDHDALRAGGITVIEQARALLAARPVALQLRAKNSSARDTLSLLTTLKPLAAAAQVPLFANDRPDLALLAGCDGVHLGQEDLPLAEVRRLAPELKIGVSTHNLPELREALAGAPDYVAYGPVFPTTSKAKPDPCVGGAGLREAVALARAASCPLVAIGGIDSKAAPLIAELGIAAAAISALLPAEGLGAEERARALAARLLGHA